MDEQNIVVPVYKVATERTVVIRCERPLYGNATREVGIGRDSCGCVRGVDVNVDATEGGAVAARYVVTQVEVVRRTCVQTEEQDG